MGSRRGKRAREQRRGGSFAGEVSHDPIKPWPAWLEIERQGDPAGDWRLTITAMWGKPVYLVLLLSLAAGAYISLWPALEGRLAGILPLIGLLCFGYPVLALVINRTVITIDHEALRVARGPLPWPGSCSVPMSGITAGVWEDARTWVLLKGGGRVPVFSQRDVGESERSALIRDLVNAILHHYANKKLPDEHSRPSFDERSLLAWISPHHSASQLADEDSPDGDSRPAPGTGIAGLGEIPDGIQVEPLGDGEAPQLHVSFKSRLPLIVPIMIAAAAPLALTWVSAHYVSSMNWYIGEPLFSLHPVRFPIDVINVAVLTLAAYLLVVLVLDRTILTLSPDRLQVRQRPLPFLFQRSLKITDLRQLVVETDYWGEMPLHWLSAILQNGRKVHLIGLGQREERLQWLKQALDMELGL